MKHVRLHILKIIHVSLEYTCVGFNLTYLHFCTVRQIGHVYSTQQNTRVELTAVRRNAGKIDAEYSQNKATNSFFINKSFLNNSTVNITRFTTEHFINEFHTDQAVSRAAHWRRVSS